jgi:hypothetical protein
VVPSADEHRILLKLVTDVAGCEDVDDHVRVDELPWERGGRSSRRPPERMRPPAAYEPPGTEDLVESAEAGIAWIPPDRPPSDEE